VRIASASTLSVSQVARDLLIAPKTLLSWVAKSKVGDLASGGGAMSWSERDQFEQLKRRTGTLETEVRLLRKCGHLLKARRDDRFAFIYAHRDEFEVRIQCRVLSVSVSGYYAWKARSPSSHALSDAELAVEVREIFEASHGRYGSPRVHQALIKSGLKTSRKRVARLMREHGLMATVPKPFKKTTLSDHDRGVAPNLLAREFEVDGRDMVWVGDISVPQKAAREMRDRPLATGLQEQVANHRMRLGSKALVVSVAEKAPRGVRCGPRRRTTVNCRSSVETAQMMSKPGVDVGPGSAWRVPVYWPRGVRHRGSAILVQALVWNCGNLRLRCEGKGTSSKSEADNTNAQPRGGATRSSGEGRETDWSKGVASFSCVFGPTGNGRSLCA